MRIIIFNIIFFFFVACSSGHKSPSIKDNRFSDKTLLNYEYTNKHYVYEIRRNHFLINIEIDEPYLVKVPFKEIPGIYPNASIDGYAIVLFNVDQYGKIKKYEIKKRAGLGIDNYLEELLKNITVEPIVHRGIRGSAKFLVRFVFSNKGSNY